MEFEDTSRVYHEFSQNGNSYSFTGRFFTEAKPVPLIHILYDFSHLVSFVTGADSIELLSNGEDWHIVRYTYSGFLFISKSTYIRNINPKRLIITFELTGTEQRALFLPELLSSAGYYKIIPIEDGCWVEYFQEATLSSDLLKGLYIRQVKNESIKFLKELRDYVNRTCK